MCVFMLYMNVRFYGVNVCNACYLIFTDTIIKFEKLYIPKMI